MVKDMNRRLLIAAMSVLFSMVLLYVTIEIGSYFTHFIIFKTVFSASYIVEKQNNIINVNTNNQIAKNKSDCIMHPYYGYAHNDNFSNAQPPRYESDSSAELGFYSPKSLTPFDRDEKYFVAITGGSVAHLFASQGREVLLDFVRKLNQVQGKEIEFFDLANWAYKQPQQLMVLSDLLHRGVRFDLLINIDGLNEVTLSIANAHVGVSPFFPSQWETASDALLSKAAMEAYGQAAMFQRWRVELAHRFHTWPHDPFLGLTWRLIDLSLEKKIVGLRTLPAPVSQTRPGDAIRLTDNGKIMLGPNRDIDPRSFGNQAVMAWARASALMADLMAMSGGRYMHVLQPNQYYPGSKKLTTQEKSVAYLADAPNKNLVEHWYPLLREAGKILQLNGVEFLDMTMVFKDVDDSLYEDTCCHFNKKGNDLFARAIGKSLLNPTKVSERRSLSLLEQQLREHGIFDHARLLQESSLNIDLVLNPGIPQLDVNGLADIEGSKDARWRWGLGPATTISFHLPDAFPVTLQYALASPFRDQEMLILFNGQTLDRQKGIEGTSQLIAPPASLEQKIILPGKKGKNTLELRYKLANGPGSVLIEGETRSLAVIFRQLRLAIEHPHQE